MRNVLLGLFGGAILGFVGGAMYMKKKMEDAVDELVDEEVKEFIDDFHAKMAEIEKDDISEEGKPVDEEPKEFSHYNSLKQPGDTYHKPDPTKLFNDPKEEHPQDPEDESDILNENPIKEKKEDDAMKGPKLISDDKFDEDESYAKDTLYYYTEDDVLTTEDEKEINNEFEYVGDCLDKFGFRNNDDESIIHVRNPEKETDYEVIKVFAAFN